MSEYEVEKILGHVFQNNDELSYLVKWKYYPPGAASLVTAANLKGAMQLLCDYHAGLGLNAICDSDQLKEKLRESAMNDYTNSSCDVVSIASHRNENGELLFQTMFQDGTLLERPGLAFLEEYEKEILEKYMREHKLYTSTPKPKKNRNTRTLTNPSAAFGGPVAPPFSSTRSRRRRPDPSPESSDGERDRAGPSRQRSISPGKNGDSHGSDIVRGSSSRVSRTAVRESQAREGRTSASPRSSRQEAERKRAGPDLTHMVADKRTKVAGSLDDGQMKVLSIFKDEGDEPVMLMKNETGQLILEELDVAFKKDPAFAFNALKAAYFAKDD